MIIKLLVILLLFSMRTALALDGGAPLDDFNRANVGPPPSAQWSNPLIPAQIGMKVVGNALACDTAGLCSAWWNVVDFPADMEVSVLWSDAVAATTSWVRLFLRTFSEGVASATGGYACQAVNDGSVFLRLVTGGGVGATLGSVSLWYSLGQWRLCRMHDARVQPLRMAQSLCKFHLDATCLCDRYNERHWWRSRCRHERPRCRGG